MLVVEKCVVCEFCASMNAAARAYVLLNYFLVGLAGIAT